MEAQCNQYDFEMILYHLCQCYVPEKDEDLPLGFYFIVKISYTDEFICPEENTIWMITRNIRERNFHPRLHEIFSTWDADSLYDLRASLLPTELPEQGQEMIMKAILDAAISVASHIPYDSHSSLIPIGVKIEVERMFEESKKEITHGKGSDPRRIPCNPRFSSTTMGSTIDAVRICTELEMERLEKGSASGLIIGQEQCVTCLEAFSAGDEVIRMPCSHVHHQNCILKWLKASDTCPTCRLIVPALIL